MYSYSYEYRTAQDTAERRQTTDSHPCDSSLHERQIPVILPFGVFLGLALRVRSKRLELEAGRP
jgi:hypothetical protein